jgi:hypothetical protein
MEPVFSSEFRLKCLADDAIVFVLRKLSLARNISVLSKSCFLFEGGNNFVLSYLVLG